MVGLATPGILPVLWQSRIWEERASWTSLELYLDSRGNKTTAVETTTPVPPATAVETTTPVPPAAFSLEVRLEMAEIGWELLFFLGCGKWDSRSKELCFCGIDVCKTYQQSDAQLARKDTNETNDINVTYQTSGMPWIFQEGPKVQGAQDQSKWQILLNLLIQWLTFKLLGITHLVGKNQV